MHFLEYVHGLAQGYESRSVDSTLSPTETMNNEWCFQVGRSAVDNILIAMASSRLQSVRKVLDIPCGHGRVLRHLVCLFRGQKFTLAISIKLGWTFAPRLLAQSLSTRKKLTLVDFGTQYDLIWVGSLFTHTNREATRRWAAHLAKFLSPHGIVVATLHGRWCRNLVDKVSPYIAEERWQAILRDYSTFGYGYRDYPRAESHSFISGSYGVSR